VCLTTRVTILDARDHQVEPVREVQALGLVGSRAVVAPTMNEHEASGLFRHAVCRLGNVRVDARIAVLAADIVLGGKREGVYSDGHVSPPPF